MERDIEKLRERVREIASEHYERGDVLGWFEALYQEANGDNEIIPWADLEPNSYFRMWAETSGLKGEGRSALVVGCGLGDDARYLYDLGFEVTAFDISPTAIEWAKRLHSDTGIRFEVCDLFEPFRGWLGGFDFVLEIYTIQPLPLDLRPSVIDAIAAFVASNGKLVVVTRGRENDVEPDELPWPMSRRDLSRFEANGLGQVSFVEMPPIEEDEPPRFVVEYLRKDLAN
ncbi:MAG: class I SAM-dependent methyltransferase [Pyrinomonadaceae bacterium]